MHRCRPRRLVQLITSPPSSTPFSTASNATGTAARHVVIALVGRGGKRPRAAGAYHHAHAPAHLAAVGRYLTMAQPSNDHDYDDRDTDEDGGHECVQLSVHAAVDMLRSQGTQLCFTRTTTHFIVTCHMSRSQRRGPPAASQAPVVSICRRTNGEKIRQRLRTHTRFATQHAGARLPEPTTSDALQVTRGPASSPACASVRGDWLWYCPRYSRV